MGHADHQESYGGCPIDVGLWTERGHLTGQSELNSLMPNVKYFLDFLSGGESPDPLIFIGSKTWCHFRKGNV